jgi:hypothetical protein
MNEEGYRLIFIDVDGVLNTTGPTHGSLVERFVRRFARLVKETCASPVLSTSWRLTRESREHVIAAFLRHGLPMPLGCTPHLPGEARGDEILAWLQMNTTNVAQGVVLEHGEFEERPGELTMENTLLPAKIKVAGFVAIDDMDMYSVQRGGTHRRLLTDEHFLKTEPDYGLTKERAKEARRLLLGGSNKTCHHCGCLHSTNKNKEFI